MKKALRIMLFLILMPAWPLWAADIRLSWTASVSQNVIGYKVYIGSSSGNYYQSQDAGNETRDAVFSLIEGQVYFFAVTAYNTSGESSYSNEVNGPARIYPNPPPGVITGVRLSKGLP
jgi:hypothetical protein